LIADANTFYEPQLQEFRYRTEELQSRYECLCRKYDALQTQHKHAMQTLNNLELEQLENASEKRRIL
jgi:hypothetical protein